MIGSTPHLTDLHLQEADNLLIKYIMNKRWIKNGVFASDTIELNGCVVCNPTEDMLRQAGYKEYQEPVPTESEKLEQAKVEKIAEITAYDTSSAVNSFILNGVPRWLNLDKRQSIAYSAKILKEKGHDSITIWFDTDKVVLPIDDAISLLDTLEVYAKTTNNVTHEHMLTVDWLSDIEEVRNFDVTAGYPRKVDY